MPQVVVYGAGGNGREIAETIIAARAAGADWDLLGFLDDALELEGTEVMGLPVLGPGEWLADHPKAQPVMGLGHPRDRRAAAEKTSNLGRAWATVIHPSAVISPSAKVGEGCVIFVGAILSNGCRLGRLVQVGFNSIVHHDTEVDDLVAIMAHVTLAGNMHVGEGTFLGIGTSTRQGTSIGEWTMVGAGASVVKDIPAYCVAVGVPARPTRYYYTPEEMPPI